MEVIRGFYSSVSSTVSVLSAALPGNPVTREYEPHHHIASAGPGLQWKIYKGHKKSTRQEVSIFVFEKKNLERFNKGEKDAILETLKWGITQLTKLRHPQILTVQHPLEESRDSLAFATEPVFASLANILGNTENMPQPLPSHIADYKLFDLEIKYGLTQLAEGLAFLHDDVKLLHKNVCPESIIVNRQGAWKIFGFDFCVPNRGSQTAPSWPFTEYCQAVHPVTQPNLDFLAPECLLRSSHSTGSDIYSLGMIIYCLHSPNGSSLCNSNDSYDKSKKFASQLKQMPASKLDCVAEGLREYVKLMLNSTPELRPDPHQLIKIPYFDDVGVKTLNYLDSLFQWDNLQKSQFFKGLPQIIQTLPHRVCIYRVLPSLVKEFVNVPMVPFVLPNVLLIAENSTKEEFTKYILPSLKPVMAIQDPIQILLIFMQKMELLLKLTPPEEIKSDVLPMLYRALESDAQQIQELCLSVIPTFASLIDFPAMKNALLPRIKKLCLTTSFLSVRVNCLVCLGKLLEHLDKWLVIDDVLPLLPQIPSREPAVLMGILGVYKLAMTHKKLGITKEIMATKILPFLMPLCIENGLTLNQFNALISLVKEMIATVESEHRTKIEQLNSIQNESKSFDVNSSFPIPNAQPVNEDLFSKLSLDSSSTQNKNISKPTNIPLINGSGSNSLTIQEKQRIAQQQESMQRFNVQEKKILSPQQKPPQPQNKPRDLTEQLMQSNLNQIMTPQKPMNFNAQFNNPLSPSSTNWSSSTSWKSPTQPSNPNMMSFQPMASVPNQNWSGLDTLLSPAKDNSQNKPMNQQPLLSNNGLNQPNSDIMDLLG